MPREIAVFGVLIPSLVPLFLAAILLQLGLDRLLTESGIYRRLWHPSLVRLCLFSLVFCGLLLWYYQW